MIRFMFFVCLLVPFFSKAEEADQETSIILFKSTGDAKNVVFHTSTSETPCEGLSHTAAVYDAELLRKKLLGFVAKMQQKSRAAFGVYPEVKLSVKANIPLQVHGKSEWSDKIGNMTTSGSCGPFTQKFTPEADRKYMALFEFAGENCGQSVQDITDSDTPVPVELEPLQCSL